MKITLVCVVACALVSTAEAQYAVNWPTQPATPMATDVQPGSQLLKVLGVNDFLYTYEINVVQISTPISIPAFPTIGAGGTCTDPTVGLLTTDSQAAQAGYQQILPASATSTKSLATSQSDWNSNVKSSYSNLSTDLSNAQTALSKITDTTQQGFCTGAIAAAKLIITTLDAANSALNSGQHEVQATFTAKSCKSEVLTVVEKYNGVPTGQSVTVRLDAECNQFTVSGGS
jgi:hypothetical protein